MLISSRPGRSVVDALNRADTAIESLRARILQLKIATESLNRAVESFRAQVIADRNSAISLGLRPTSIELKDASSSGH